MAILVNMDDLKNKKVSSNKFETNKLFLVVVFVISIFLVKLAFEFLKNFINININNILGQFYDVVTILIALFITYIYAKKKYLKKEYFHKGFLDLSKKENKDIKLEPKILKKLGNDNYILKNISFSNKGGINHIETAVMNEKGIFIIYHKKDIGIISGDCSNDKWNLNYNGENKKVNNPIILLKSQKNRLQKYIKEKGYNIKVIGVLYYSSDDLILNIKNKENNIIAFSRSFDKEFLKYIENFKSNNINFDEVIDVILEINK